MSTLEKSDDMESLDDIFGKIVGVVPDTGKALEEYKEERIKERYEIIYHTFDHHSFSIYTNSPLSKKKAIT